MELDQFSGIQALIFDVDGTLADSMPAHLESWQLVGKTYGFVYSEADFRKNAGMAGQEIVELINEQQNLHLDADAVSQAKEEAFLKSLNRVKAVQPVVSLVEKFHNQFPIAAGTGGFRHVAIKTLQHIGVYDKISVLVAADDVEHHKPAPDTFLKCAEVLQVDPERCLVFEDAELGFQAAEKAGMHAIDVRPFYLDVFE